MRRPKTPGETVPRGGGALGRASQFALSRGLPPPVIGAAPVPAPAVTAKKKPASKPKRGAHASPAPKNRGKR